MSALADMIADDIQREGTLATLRRSTGTGDVHFDVDVYAFHNNSAPVPLAGEISQANKAVRISNREILARQWPGPPRDADTIFLAGRPCRIMDVETLFVGGEVVEHVLQVRGL